MNASEALGRQGEQLAAEHLRQSGMRILDRNWRCQEGELDIVAADRRALVVCEVKTRSDTRFGTPLEAISARKHARLRRLAVRWVAALVAVGLVWLAWSVLAGGQTDLLTPRWFQELSERLRFTEIRLLPSWWLSTGLLEAIRRPMPSVADDRPWSESIMYLSLLISKCLCGQHSQFER